MQGKSFWERIHHSSNLKKIVVVVLCLKELIKKLALGV